MAGIILGGTAGGETLTGTSEGDSIYGNGGNDACMAGLATTTCSPEKSTMRPPAST